MIPRLIGAWLAAIGMALWVATAVPALALACWGFR